MAVSIITYTADGSTNQFSITFDYINQSHVVVKVNGATALFTFLNASTIQTNSTPTAGQKVEIRRVTPVAALVDFTDGSTLFEADLDLADKQSRLVAEEAKDIADDAKTTVEANITNIDTVAGIASNVTTVAGISSSVTSVVGNETNVNTVAGDAANINALAAQTTQLGLLGTSDAVADMNTLGTSDVVSDMNTLGTSSNVTNMDTLAGISSNITTVAGVASNVTTVAGSISNVNATASNISSVNTNATNISAIQGASGNASTATTKASEAASSATGAAASATSAATAQTAAEAARDSALAAFDSFDDRYLGAKSSAPSVDNDGNALVSGALYYDTTANAMQVYTGSAWVAAYASLSGALLVTNNLSDLNNAATSATNLGLGTGNTPTFNGVNTTGDISFGDSDKAKFGASNDLEIFHDSNNSYIDENGTGSLNVRTINGAAINLISGSDYMATFTTDGAASLYYDNSKMLETTSTGVDIAGGFTATDGSTITTADNTTQLTLKSTDDDATEGPRLDLRRDSASPAAGDLIGTIRYLGDDAGGTTRVFGEIQLEADDVTDGSEDGQMVLIVRNNGTLRSAVQINSIEVVFNEASDDVDFRVESDTATHALFVQGSDGKVGIGEASPSHTLHVNSGSTNIVGKFESTDSVAGVALIDNAGGAEIAAVGNDLVLYPAGVEKVRLDSSGNLLVGTTGTATSSYGAKFIKSSSASTILAVHRQSNNGNVAEWGRGGNSVGSISVTSSSTSYNTSSDYRLKENVTGIADGITRVKQLAPKRFNFIADADTAVDGFIAHEAQAVVPEAVTGTHNEVDDDGNAKMQGIDQAKLVPLLTAALQEAIVKIETLETKVAALEGA